MDSFLLQVVVDGEWETLLLLAKALQEAAALEAVVVHERDLVLEVGVHRHVAQHVHQPVRLLLPAVVKPQAQNGATCIHKVAPPVRHFRHPLGRHLINPRRQALAGHLARVHDGRLAVLAEHHDGAREDVVPLHQVRVDLLGDVHVAEGVAFREQLGSRAVERASLFLGCFVEEPNDGRAFCSLQEVIQLRQGDFLHLFCRVFCNEVRQGSSVNDGLLEVKDGGALAEKLDGGVALNTILSADWQVLPAVKFGKVHLLSRIHYHHIKDGLLCRLALSAGCIGLSKEHHDILEVIQGVVPALLVDEGDGRGNFFGQALGHRLAVGQRL
mmetsp:Transcript_13908/g.35513  ORF Transcript_13908/g.35513 Transcript_13908/m.35513 type:complete len:327 (-) Transcript_13908:146-1126(-)